MSDCHVNKVEGEVEFWIRGIVCLVE
jgi:hypothetical protein